MSFELLNAFSWFWNAQRSERDVRPAAVAKHDAMLLGLLHRSAREVQRRPRIHVRAHPRRGPQVRRARGKSPVRMHAPLFARVAQKNRAKQTQGGRHQVLKSLEWEVEWLDGCPGEPARGHGNDFVNGERRARACRWLHDPIHGDGDRYPRCQEDWHHISDSLLRYIFALVLFFT